MMKTSLNVLLTRVSAAKRFAALVLCVLVSFFFTRGQAYAQHERTVRVIFPFDSAVISEDYIDNQANLAAVDSIASVCAAEEGRSINIVSYSSPEGNYSYNKALSERRANALRKYILSKYPTLEGKVTVSPEAESWDDLRRSVARDSRMDNASKDRVIAIIDSEDAPDAKEALLKQVPAYKQLYSRYFRSIRFAEISLRSYGTVAVGGKETVSEESEEEASGNGSEISRQNANSAGSPRRSASSRSSVLFNLNEDGVTGEIDGNEEVFAEIRTMLDGREAKDFKSLIITSSSSIDGPVAKNERLAMQRGLALRRWIEENYPQFKGQIAVRSNGEAWEETRTAVLENDQMDSELKARTLAIIDSNDTPASKEMRLKKLDGWDWIKENILPETRRATVRGSLTPLAIPDIPELSCDIDDSDGFGYALDLNDGAYALDKLPVSEPSIRVFPPLKYKYPIFAASTNLLYDALITPNFALELPLGNKWSVYAEYAFPWWVTKGNDRAWEMLKWDLGVRRWLSPMNPNDPMDILRGHFVGLDLSAGYYDVEPHHKGWQGEFQLVGLEYGYAWKWGDNWRLDAFIGAGWMGTHYRYYEANDTDEHLIYQYHGKMNWLGPTKVGFSLKYIFDYKLDHKKETGR